MGGREGGGSGRIVSLYRNEMNCELSISSFISTFHRVRVLIIHGCFASLSLWARFMAFTASTLEYWFLSLSLSRKKTQSKHLYTFHHFVFLSLSHSPVELPHHVDCVSRSLIKYLLPLFDSFLIKFRVGQLILAHLPVVAINSSKAMRNYQFYHENQIHSSQNEITL